MPTPGGETPEASSDVYRLEPRDFPGGSTGMGKPGRGWGPPGLRRHSESRGGPAGGGQSLPRRGRAFCGARRPLLPLPRAAIAAFSASLHAWTEPSQLQGHALSLTLAPVTLGGPLVVWVVDFWLPLLAFGPELCRPRFPSHLLLCVSLLCVGPAGLRTWYPNRDVF